MNFLINYIKFRQYWLNFTTTLPLLYVQNVGYDIYITCIGSD